MPAERERKDAEPQTPPALPNRTPIARKQPTASRTLKAWVPVKDLRGSSPLLRMRSTLSCVAIAAAVALPSLLPAQPLEPAEIPVPEIRTALGTLPGPEALPLRPQLPPVLVMNDGTHVTTREHWLQRRAEIRATLEYYATGRMPPPPGNVRGRVVTTETLLDGKATYRLVQLTLGPGGQLDLAIGILAPAGDGPHPAVIFPGGTPPGATPLPLLPRPPGQGKGVNALLPPAGPPLAQTPPPPESAAAVAARVESVLARGYAYVMFNHQDCAEDTTLRLDDGSWAFRSTRFPVAYPGYDWGTLAVWAWGVSRIVDHLETDPMIDARRLIVCGVSRTGKSAMIAAAFDERIAMAAPCVTGGGGIGAYRFSGDGRGGKEGLDLMMKKYPNWFSPHLHGFRGQTDRLPFDQHWFLALVAPRPFLALEGTTDPVSLEQAVRQSLLGARPAYALLGAEDRLGVNYADHGHTFNADDWSALLDFADKHLRGRAIDRDFARFPGEG